MPTSAPAPRSSVSGPAVSTAGPPAAVAAAGLVIVGRAGVSNAPAPAPDSKWLAALPAARNALALGADAVALAGAHQTLHPSTLWTLAADAAIPDAGSFDLIVVGQALSALLHDAARLDALTRCASPGAQLIAAIDNAASAPAIERLLQGDVSPDAGTADTAAHALVPATAYKLLMDAGWMPTLVDNHPCAPHGDASARALRGGAAALGVGPGCVDLVHRMSRLVIDAQRSFDEPPANAAAASTFCVVVPTNEERQLRANVELSPGLAEVGARVVSCRGASNPAAALAQALPHCDRDWVLLCHQDVYFPKGFGHMLNAQLSAVPAEARARMLIGFVGIGIDRHSREPVPAGFVIDRLHRADHLPSETALSLDELAIVIARDSIHRIDPYIGWHLWATDLCLTAIEKHRVFPRIVRLPLFHNSRTGWTLPPSFADAAERLLAKHPGYAPIHTLCGELDAAFIARQRAAGAGR